MAYIWLRHVTEEWLGRCKILLISWPEYKTKNYE